MFAWKVRRLKSAVNRASFSVAIVVVANLPSPAVADLNVWTKTSSGYWEEPFWSLGTLPTNGQYVAITNEGWKAVAIGPTTTQNYPSNLTVYSLTISSPNNSYNQLLMNYAGLQMPLAARLLTVASNSSLSMLYSWLYLDGGNGEGLSVGGEVDQDVSSVVTGSQADVGWIGPGVYNLKSGALALNQLYLGGSFGGQFNQYDGSCDVGLLHLYPNGAYNFYGGGDYPTNIYFLGGTFFIRDGIRQAPIETGNYVQTGGTNYAPIGFSYYSTPGSYILSNGVSFIPDLPIMYGGYSQWGGSQTVTGMVSVYANPGGFRSGPVIGGMGISGGSFSCSGIYDEGHYDQSGGTNIVRGTITVEGVLATLHQEGGVLVDDDVVVNSASSYTGDELRQCGGLHIINKQLSIYGLQWSGSGAPVCGASVCVGAQMVVSNIVIRNGGVLNVGDRTITQSGALTCSSGLLVVGPGSHQFGALGSEGSSALVLPQNTNCTVRFGDGGYMAGTFVISNWCGSVNGGGIHQVFLGKPLPAPGPEPLSAVRFQDPLGLPPGSYGARVLPGGEVVPAVLPIILITDRPDHSKLLAVVAQNNLNYSIETSTNLKTWIPWTTGVATGGVWSVPDYTVTNGWLKFYRAVLLP